MIRKLDVPRIKKFWDEIAPLLEGGLWPVSDANIETIYNALVDEKIFCYVIIAEGDVCISAIILVGITRDTLSGSRTMMLLTVRELKSVKAEEWADAFVMITKDAHEKGCNYISGFSASKYVSELAQKLGGNADYNFISFSLGE